MASAKEGEPRKNSNEKIAGGLLVVLGALAARTPLLAVALVVSGVWVWRKGAGKKS